MVSCTYCLLNLSHQGRPCGRCCTLTLPTPTATYDHNWTMLILYFYARSSGFPIISCLISFLPFFRELPISQSILLKKFFKLNRRKKKGMGLMKFCTFFLLLNSHLFRKRTAWGKWHVYGKVKNAPHRLTKNWLKTTRLLGQRHTKTG